MSEEIKIISQEQFDKIDLMNQKLSIASKLSERLKTELNEIVELKKEITDF